MPIELKEENGGRILDVVLTGTLVKDDYGALIAAFQRLARVHGCLRVLLDMTRFRGWDAGGMWEEIKFDLKHLGEMDRLAVIGEKKWQHAIAEFAKPFTPAATRYFDAAKTADARAWIEEPA